MTKKMYRVWLVAFFISGRAVCFAGPADDQVVAFFKFLLKKNNACKNYDEYERFSRRYSTKEMLEKMNSPQAAQMPQEFKENVFSLVKQSFFDPAELEIKKVDVTGQKAVIAFGRQGHPGLKGRAIFLKEDGHWKVQEISQTGGGTSQDLDEVRGLFESLKPDSQKQNNDHVPYFRQREKARERERAEQIRRQRQERFKPGSLKKEIREYEVGSTVEIRLESGKVYKGKVLEQTEDHVKIKQGEQVFKINHRHIAPQ